MPVVGDRSPQQPAGQGRRVSTGRGPGPGRSRRRPLRHGSANSVRKPVVRSAAVVRAVVALLALTAGLTVLLWTFAGPAGDHSATSPVPRVTVTAEPVPEPDSDGQASTLAGGAGPITAAEVPQTELSPDAPTVVVGPGVDVSKHSSDDPASPWVVVNKTRPVDPQSWVPPQLDSVGAAELVPQAATALQEMLDAAGAEDVLLRTGSGYRSHGFQESIYGDYAAEHGADRADRFSARPGFSEHQTGWAVDVFGSEQCRIKECFADEPAGVWVADHAHEYGFVIRYPRGEEDVTGYRFEPWHIRYVGPELATAMREHGIATLEQALGLPAAPDYN